MRAWVWVNSQVRRKWNFQRHVKEARRLWLRFFLWFKGTETYSHQLSKMVYCWRMCSLQTGWVKATEIYLCIVISFTNTDKQN